MSSIMIPSGVPGSRSAFCGSSPDGRLVEAVELPGKRFYIGVQFHPEFKSRPNKAHPLFREFIKASLDAQAEKHD